LARERERERERERNGKGNDYTHNIEKEIELREQLFGKKTKKKKKLFKQ
jgi:hypothetical protein